MVDYATASYPEILAAVADDRVVDAEETAALRARLLGPDGNRVIDQTEAEFLFELNDYVTDNEEYNCPEYEELFVEAIIGYLMDDNFSPGGLDDMEWLWLKDMIAEDGNLDGVECRLLEALTERVTSVPEDFEEFLESFQEVEYKDDGPATLGSALRNIGGKVRKAKAMLTGEED